MNSKSVKNMKEIKGYGIKNSRKRKTIKNLADLRKFTTKSVA